MLEEVYHWRWALRIYSLTPLLVYFLCFRLTVMEVISQLPAPIIMSESYTILPYHDGNVFSLESLAKLTAKKSHNNL